ncbi:cyclodeaminase/cyclohydrolase family protein [Actinoalloteichus sp. GBA129-24]|uniref:cyclodeaminase/cyclohydrolase family protein n=1 Tax=Actinoalloteichus sp. GBA129-24 TaxID=1612551 RepID=UPI00095095BE|nr:cyclodeaminase/cyclohydrolase family protein [Actinoalloteichus sp. GBA129-24]APU21116.1 methenyl tetrahydrofolate cyclohydrolase [Actinoalloteichus sp. GBA129-24]
MRERSIEEFLDQLAAREPTPGGGASAALHAAQSAALLAMVARYTDGERHAEHAEIVGNVLVEAEELRAVALDLAERDALAFGAVGDAYRLSRRTDEEKAVRKEAIQHALSGAARPPADTIAVVARLLALAEELLPVGNRNVITDVAASAEAARAAAAASRVNVEINLAGLADVGAREALRAEVAGVDDLQARAHRLTEAVREMIR